MIVLYSADSLYVDVADVGLRILVIIIVAVGHICMYVILDNMHIFNLMSFDANMIY